MESTTTLIIWFQSNNNIEGIRDDLETIYQVIHKIYGSVSIEVGVPE